LPADRIQRILKEEPADGLPPAGFYYLVYDRFRRLNRRVIDTVIAVTAEMVTTMVNIARLHRPGWDLPVPGQQPRAGSLDA